LLEGKNVNLRVVEKEDLSLGLEWARAGLGLGVLLGIEIPLTKIAACSEETDGNFSKERARIAENEKATKKKLWVVFWEVVCQCCGSVFAEVVGQYDHV
jgi:hypothetical protein